MLFAPSNLPDQLDSSRRKMLQFTASMVAAMALPCFGQTPGFWSSARELWLYRPATGETVREVYWADGALVTAGYIAICNLLRDVHANQAVQYDLVTLDIVCGVSDWLHGSGVDKPIIVTSGYRTSKTNADEGGVRNSYHTLAQAIDIRIDGVSAESVANFGKTLAIGGVGFYRTKQFIHLDRGRIRYWRG